MKKFAVILSVFMFIFIRKASLQTTDSTTEEICQGAQENCKQCLMAHPSCSWCSDNSTDPSARCRIASVTRSHCSPGHIQNPEGKVDPTKNDEFTEITSYDPEVINNLNITQLRPQAATIDIRYGEPQIVNLTFKRVVDYPLDLYYVMDLSYSMKDDLQKLQSLGENLARDIQKVTRNVRLGFGTFVDKVMMPYASTVPELLQNPCLRTENETCAPVFGFRHQLSITDEESEFAKAVRDTKISGNIDSPEGGFDALMQIAVCQNLIKWRDDALRVILFTTDASSHIAMDGKLAAILEINDMQCHLQKEGDFWIYQKSKLQDYPSIGQLKRVFEENKIQTIFAVTSNVIPLYQDLPSLLENSFVAELNSDSSNVVEIIGRSYEALRSVISLNNPSVPEHLEIKTRVLCPNEDWQNDTLRCGKVSLNETVVFQFIISATGCPADPNQVDTIEITSGSIPDRTTLSVNYASCQCECAKERQVASFSCSKAGDFECGNCYCYPEASGQRCQCTASTTGLQLEANCTANPTAYEPGATLCSGEGSCICGRCECNVGFKGDSCECRGTGCPNECGGPEKGVCNNCNGDGKCICHENKGYFFNKKLKDCSCHEASCIAPNSTLVCNDEGTCDCDRCVCKSFRTGRFCTRCEHPQCTDIIDGCAGPDLRECAFCVYVSRRGQNAIENECRANCTEKGINFELAPELLKCESCVADCEKCNYYSPNRTVHQPQECTANEGVTGCDVTYKIFWNSDKNQYVVQVREPRDLEDCPQPPSPLYIVPPVAAGIVLLGLLALLLWKIFQTIRDKHEYEQFLEDTKQSKWSKGENPLFDNPTNRIENPAYIGAN